MASHELIFQTSLKRQIVDITDEVNGKLSHLKAQDGLCFLFSKHTTAALTVCEIEEGTVADFLEFTERVIPTMNFRHTHKPNHAPDHIIGALIGPSLVLPVVQGKLDLGTWQRIAFLELDGPRQRQVKLTVT